MLILGIESSCDETAAAVMDSDRSLLSSVIDTQVAIHSQFGGVVPELASRRHLETIYPVVNHALDQAGIRMNDLDGIAVTCGPGLVGSLLIGLSFTKAIAAVTGLPFIGVDHMAGHLHSVFLNNEGPSFPFIALAVSGGHTSIYLVEDHLTYRLLGRTRDDAAGEAFDKVAKLLGLGYPGGPFIAEQAGTGNREAIRFPRAWLAPDSFDFSFSGIKTAVVNYVHKRRQLQKELNRPNICASFQEALVEVLVEKTIRAGEHCRVRNLALVGGVAANKRLREALQERAADKGFELFCPPLEFCTDNAAMIALAGYHCFQSLPPGTMEMDAYSRTSFDENGYLLLT